MKTAYKKGLKVKVISGADKGKTGSIIKFYAKKDEALVEGVNVKTHFDKKDGLLKKESPIHISKIQPAK